jgi:hypothetical protein
MKPSHDQSTRPPRGRGRLPRAGSLLIAACLVITTAGPVWAAAPGNDLPSGAAEIGSLPFAIDQDTTEAGVGSDDVGCGAGGYDVATVWYSFSPVEDVRVEIDARASDYLVGVNLFAGSADESGRFDCNNDALAFDATAGTTYYLLFADVNDDGINGGSLRAEVIVAPPSLNVSLTADPTANVHPKTGQARITGTIACDRQAEFAEVSVSLRLATGRFITVGGGADSTSCGPTRAKWSAIVTGENDRFTGGLAAVEVTAFACDVVSCSETAEAGSVRLRAAIQLSRSSSPRR